MPAEMPPSGNQTSGDSFHFIHEIKTKINDVIGVDVFQPQINEIPPLPLLS